MRTMSVRANFLVLLGIFLFAMASLCPEARAELSKGKGPAQKLARGITHVIASPFQIPKEVIQAAAEADPVWLAPWRGFATGGGSGLYHMGRQGVSGLWDIFTFWTPAARNWGPLFEPSSLVPEV